MNIQRGITISKQKQSTTQASESGQPPKNGEPTNQVNEELESNTRIALLQYYSSGSGAHASHLIALAIGIFAVIQAFSNEFTPQFYLNGFEVNSVVIDLILTSFLTLGCYLASRLIYYNIISGHALHCPIISDNEADQKNLTHNLLDKLNYACIQGFEENNKLLRNLIGSDINKRAKEKNKRVEEKITEEKSIEKGRKYPKLKQGSLFAIIFGLIFGALFLLNYYGIIVW